MRLVSLEPFVTDVVSYCGGGEKLVGMTHLCSSPVRSEPPAIVTRAADQSIKLLNAEDACLVAGLSRFPVDVPALKATNAEVIFTRIVAVEPATFIPWAQELLARLSGRTISIKDVSAPSLECMYQVVEEVGLAVGRAREARDLINRAKAQLMEWADSFLARCKGKKVVVLAGASPLQVAEQWIPGLIRLLSAQPFVRTPERRGTAFDWQEVREWRPDVIVVAPEGCSLQESVKLLPTLKELPGWDELPAVKRGEVIFCDGSNLYRAGPRFIRGAAVLTSAIAGLDSGYITERDEYYKIGYIELFRHRFS